MNRLFTSDIHRHIGSRICLLSVLSFVTVSIPQSHGAGENTSDQRNKSAKETPPLVQEVDKVGKALELDKFTVTATRDGHRYGPRKTNSTSRIAVDFQDLPQMVVSLPKELMQDVAAFRLEDIIKYAGGATRGPNANGDNYVIRGLASVATGATVDGSPSTSASDRDLFFFERVDVIKGPSSILAPTGPAGGTVNLISKSPESEFKAYARVQAGQYDANRVEFDVTGPTLNEAVDYRFGAAYHNADGYHDYTHREKKMFLGGLKFHLTDRNKITLKVNHEDMKGEPDLGFVVADNAPSYPAAVPRTFNQNPDGSYWNENKTFGSAVLNSTVSSWLYLQLAFHYAESNHQRINGLLSQFLGGIPQGTTIVPTANTDWVEFNGRNSGLLADFAAYYDIGPATNVTTFGLALESASSEQNSRLQASNTTEIDLLSPQRNRILNADISTWPYQAGTQYRGKSNGTRFYVNNSATFYENVIVSTGFSWNGGRSSTTFPATAPDGISLLPAGSDGERRDVGTARPQTLYNYGILYKATDYVSLYYGHNELLSFVNAVNPETGEVAPNTQTEQDEFGIKATLFDGKLQASIAKYRIHQGGAPTVDLIKKTWIFRPGRLSDGFDIDLTLQLSNKLTLIAGYGYADVTTPTGRRPLGVPKTSARAWAMVNAPSDALKNFGLGIGFDYTGKRNGDLFNELNIVGAPFRTDETPFLLPSYTKVDLAFFYRDPKRKWEISLKINNVLDTMYIRQSTVPFAVVMAPGRNILGNVTYRF